jgi:hypothetical protein
MFTFWISNGAAGDAPSPAIPEALLHTLFLRVSIAAHELQRRAGDLTGHFVREAFCQQAFAQRPEDRGPLWRQRDK